MAEVRQPAVARHRLLAALRRLREQAGFSQQQVADHFSWSLSKTVRIESGAVGASVSDILALAALYGADEATREELRGLAKAAKEKRWWRQYRVLSPAMHEYLGYEADAVSIYALHPTVVPGLLQTESYARALAHELTLEPATPAITEQYVQIRLRRQAETLSGPDGTRYTALVDEWVLRRPVGGPEVMREQLLHLKAMIDDDCITFGVIPLSQGAYFGLAGGFEILFFGPGENDAVLYQENAQSSLAQQKPELVRRYRERFEQILGVALTGPAAAALIASVAAVL